MQNSSFQKKRWTKAENYSDSWGERNVMLVNLAESCGVFDEVDSLVEYGCGPNAPLSSCALQRKPSLNSTVCDITAWNDKTRVVDLNSADLDDLPPADCASLSGVLEYIDDPSALLHMMASRYGYLLLSYCPTDFSRIKNRSVFNTKADIFKGILRNRIASGFRTHYNSDRIVECCSDFGYPVAVDIWREQLLMILKGKQKPQRSGNC